MKRKRTSQEPEAPKADVASTDVHIELEPEEPVVPVLAQPMPRKAKNTKCVVCSEPCAPNATDDLCWVCRRLKLSAWRDADAQMPAQE